MLSAAGHRERMRKRAASMGLEALPPQDLIELLLYSSIPRRDVKPLAAVLLKRFGSVEQILSASEEQLRMTEGIGQRTAQLLCSAGRLCRAYEALEGEDRPALKRAEDIPAFADTRALPEGNGLYLQVSLSASGAVLRTDVVDIYSEESMRTALAGALTVRSAHAVLIGKSEGSAAISEAEIQRLRQFEKMLRTIGVRLFDVVASGDGRVSSLKANGIL